MISAIFTRPLCWNEEGEPGAWGKTLPGRYAAIHRRLLTAPAVSPLSPIQIAGESGYHPTRTWRYGVTDEGEGPCQEYQLEKGELRPWAT